MKYPSNFIGNHIPGKILIPGIFGEKSGIKISKNPILKVCYFSYRTEAIFKRTGKFPLRLSLKELRIQQRGKKTRGDSDFGNLIENNSNSLGFGISKKSHLKATSRIEPFMLINSFPLTARLHRESRVSQTISKCPYGPN